MAMTVSHLAKASGVSVRTLHHYDEIGLLRPSGRSDAGYRLYEPADLERLQQVLFFRELEFPLEEIGKILDDPGFDLGAALRMQRQLLAEKSARAQALIAAVDDALARLEKGKTMSESEMFEAWKDFKPEEHEEEAKQRWGHTDAWKISKERTARYTKADWEAMGREAASIYRKLADLMVAGTPPTDPAAMDAAEEHRAHISKWFYPCPSPMHRGLGELYVNDPRFTANIDRMSPGLAQYMHDAIHANSER